MSFEMKNSDEPNARWPSSLIDAVVKGTLCDFVPEYT